MKNIKSKFILLASNLLICFAAFVALAPCVARSYEPPMPDKLRKQMLK